MAASQVRYLIRSTGVRGLSVNILMVKLLPRLAMSLASVACTLLPSGSVPSSRGWVMDMVLPHLSPSLLAKESSSRESSNLMFVLTDPSRGSL